MTDRRLYVVSADVQEAVQKLMDDSWKSIVTRDRNSTGAVKRLKVLCVQHNANPALWTNYVQQRNEIKSTIEQNDILNMTNLCRQPPLTFQILEKSTKYKEALGSLDTCTNEFLLFHGARKSAVESICSTDFKLNLSGMSAGSLYGPGVYFAECSSKSDEYSVEEQDGLLVMLLCRVTCGRLFCTDERGPDTHALVQSCTGNDARYHAVLGDRERVVNTYREFVIFNNDQAYPEYVITYCRE